MTTPGPDEDRPLSGRWYAFVAFCLFVLLMTVLARANVPNAREIAQILGITPHKPVTMLLMTLSLAVSLGFGGFAGYLLVWWDGRSRARCLVGSAVMAAGAALLLASPQLVRWAAP